MGDDHVGEVRLMFGIDLMFDASEGAFDLFRDYLVVCRLMHDIAMRPDNQNMVIGWV